MHTREMFRALRDATQLARADGGGGGGGGARLRRLSAEIDLLRAAVAVAAAERASEADRSLLARLVVGAREEALAVSRERRLAREAAAQMMD